MPGTAGTGLVVYRARAGVDAIDAYTRRLVEALAASGTAARYVPDGPGSADLAFPHPPWLLLQYNPFAYGRAGFAPGLVPVTRRLLRRTRAPLAVMVHEAWVDMTDAKSSLIGAWQRAQLGALLRLADGVLTSTEALAREIGRGAVHVPIAANIEPVSISHEAAHARVGLDGRLAIALFGRGNPDRALDHAEAAIAALTAAHGSDRLVILNLGADAPVVRVPPKVELRSPGELSPADLSLWLAASDLVLLPFHDGVSTRRGTLMSALAHGRAVLACRGPSTDSELLTARGALALTPVGDVTGFARAAVELTADPRRLRALGDAGRQLYESRFAWAVVADRVGAELERISANRAGAGRIVFVAHEVGGSGGMERQSERLVSGLLAAGRPVTVVARSCSVPERGGLRYIRVRTPRRPAALGYPAFFAVASMLLAGRRDGLLHTTGAIVANRADVSTVHYCHRAAVIQVKGSRASRSGPLYRMNSAINGVLSRAGEAWCYRPGRTRLLCAVSDGVAAELRDCFPNMAGGVRSVANGVDSTIFRPDSAHRRDVRADLGVDDRTMLALFAGGDWERKGLAHAVDALALTENWHLAVAGRGDPTPYVLRAQGACTQARLHFLGRVHDMARLYAGADAFLFPSAYEAFPLVVLEAAAVGLPLLVTRVNGVKDLLHDGGNGWFIRRDAADIARRLNQLGADPRLSRVMGDAARRATAPYSWEAVAQGYLSIYAELE